MKRSEKIAQLQASRQKSLDDAQAILDLGTEESLTAEQTAQVKAHMDAAEQVGNEIAAVAAEETELAAAAQRLEALRSTPINAEIGRLVNSGPRCAPTPQGKQKWTLPAQARKHAGRVTAFSDDGVSDGFTKEEKAYRFGQFALAKAGLDLPGTYSFPHANRFCQDHGMLNAAHLEGGSDTTGSHVFVPEEFGQDLIRLREEYGVARKICKIVPMNSDTRIDPRWDSGLTAYFTGEGTAMTESTMASSTVRLTAKKMTAISSYSSELSEDSVIDFGNNLAQEISYAMALKEDQCLIDGDGTSTYGGIRGLKNQFATTTLGTNPGYRDTTTSNTWAATVIADLTSLISVVPVYAQQGMRFLCSSQYYYQVMVPLLNAAGGITGTEMQNGFRTPMFQGIPVMFSQVMGTATATNTIAVFLGNFAMGVSFGDRRRQTLEFSKEGSIGGVSLFERDLIGVKSSQRIDINVHNVGTNSAAGPIVALSTGT